MAGYFYDGAHGSNAVYVCLQKSTNTELYMKIITSDEVGKLERALEKMRTREYYATGTSVNVRVVP